MIRILFPKTKDYLNLLTENAILRKKLFNTYQDYIQLKEEIMNNITLIDIRPYKEGYYLQCNHCGYKVKSKVKLEVMKRANEFVYDNGIIYCNKCYLRKIIEQ
jgi:hypothetical protein